MDSIAFTHCDDSDGFDLNHPHEANFTHNISDLISYYNSSVYVHDVTRYNEQHHFVPSHLFSNVTCSDVGSYLTNSAKLRHVIRPYNDRDVFRS